jgi:hypothetical protein
LEKAILDHKFTQGYDLERHYKYASWSSGSPITLDLRVFITLRLLGGASYLDMIWYGLRLCSIPALFWETTCDIDKAVDNINFLMDVLSVMQVADN